MEIKILCPCGAKYKFDVEPAHGKMPGPVSCPVCGADGTEAGNRIITESLAKTSPASPISISPSQPAAPVTRIPSPPVGTVPQVSIPKPVSPTPAATASQPVRVSPSGSSAAGAPKPGGFVAPAIPKSSKESASSPSTNAPIQVGAVASAAAVAAAPPSANPLVPKPGTGGTKLSVSGMHAAPPPAEGTAAPQSAPTPIPTVSALPQRSKSSEYAGPSNKRGIIGAIIGGVIGMLIWAALIVITDREIGWVAWGVGLLTGFSAKMIGRGESTEIGIAAAIAAFIAILMGQFLATRHAINGFLDAAVKEGYEEHIEYAKEAAQLKTDDQIKTFLAKHDSDEDMQVTPAQITSTRISEFKNSELPALRKAAKGELSRTEYERNNRAEFEQLLSTRFILSLSFSWFTLLWVFLGVGSAYRLASAG